MRRHFYRRVSPLPLLALLLGAGCASSGEQASDDYSPNVLTRQQIQAVNAPDAYQAVERLRGSWLVPKGTAANPVRVYLDDQRMGSVNELSRIEADAIEYIRYFPPTEASARWGLNHSSGAILVSTDPL